MTSGASDTIFMNFLSRSSRPTGPKMRVPRGSPSFLRMTAPFSSNLMYEPSWRRVSLTVRTMTALTTSPFLTLPPGIASLTVATMTSPRPAYRRPEPPSTRVVSSSLAPVLSATLRRDSCWIISLLRLLEDLDEAPALRGRDRPRLADHHEVADAGLTALVVRLHLGGAADDLAVQRVLHPVLDLDDDRLVHLVARHVAATDLAVSALRRRRGGRGRGRLRGRRGRLCHQLFS